MTNQPISPEAALYLDQAMTLIRQGQAEAALDSFDLALQLEPSHPPGHYNKGTLLVMLGRHADALICFDQALNLRPDFAEAHLAKGNAYKALERYDEALAAYDLALAIRPDHAAAHYNKGVVLDVLERLQEALACLDLAISLRPDYALAHNNKSAVLNKLDRYAEALLSSENALSHKFDYPEAHTNKSMALIHLNRYEEALLSSEQAINLKPNYPAAHLNKGMALDKLGRCSQALACYRHSREQQTDYVNGHWNEALSLLKFGHYAEGFAKYEWRWRLREHLADREKFAGFTLWLGEPDLAGKTILLCSEQGLGDTLQFCRYAIAVAAQGATILLAVQAPLKTLLATLPGIHAVYSDNDELPGFDCYCPLASLPLAFQTRLDSIPNQLPYLSGEAGKVAAWQAQLGAKSKPRIGLVWSGNIKPDPNRSIPLATLCTQLSADLQFISLQKELRPNDQEALAQNPQLQFFGDQLHDFSDTAALIELMDLVISIDTSVAHLAGAMGKPVWLLLPFNADWRWLLERDDSPWYPTMRLFRQPAFGDWDSVLAQVRVELLRHHF